jgi:hypothetical protein
VQALADLRFIHRVGTLSTKRAAYAGRKFAAFTIDLSTWTSTRSEQIKPISFWEREGKQKIRDPKLIYTPSDVPAWGGCVRGRWGGATRARVEFENEAAVGS